MILIALHWLLAISVVQWVLIAAGLLLESVIVWAWLNSPPHAWLDIP